ncbi:hypothetical protein IWW35_000482 [Coemansia sp. RSA 1878]|nr:hypothetical protein IWW35_000482 [Coemansia sp. RSA 1878]
MEDPSNAVYTTASMFNTSAKGLRAHWAADVDYMFFETLAKHTSYTKQDGMAFNHKYADADIINDVTRDLAAKRPIPNIVQDLAIKFSNKIEQHRSHESIELLIELKKVIPEFNFRQINNKHINMWTRVIVPFRQVFESGTLYKGKSMFHKDCKRFNKVIMEFVASINTTGLEKANYNMYCRAGKGSKQLEQWLTAMLHIHKQNMVEYLFSCSAKMAFTYICSKGKTSCSQRELEFLNTTSHSPRSILLALKDYMDEIVKYEKLDSTSDPSLVAEIMAMRNSNYNAEPKSPVVMNLLSVPSQPARRNLPSAPSQPVARGPENLLVPARLSANPNMQSAPQYLRPYNSPQRSEMYSQMPEQHLRMQERYSHVPDRYPHIPEQHLRLQERYSHIPQRHPHIPERYPQVSEEYPHMAERYPQMTNRYSHPSNHYQMQAQPAPHPMYVNDMSYKQPMHHPYGQTAGHAMLQAAKQRSPYNQNTPGPNMYLPRYSSPYPQQSSSAGYEQPRVQYATKRFHPYSLSPNQPPQMHSRPMSLKRPVRPESVSLPSVSQLLNAKEMAPNQARVKPWVSPAMSVPMSANKQVEMAEPRIVSVEPRSPQEKQSEGSNERETNGADSNVAEGSKQTTQDAQSAESTLPPTPNPQAPDT